MYKKEETVQRVSRWYVSDDGVQVFFPYKDSITILNKDGIVYSHENQTDTFINNYLNDNRRDKFPYSNIPAHFSRVNFVHKYIYINQILNFDEPYIRINDGRIMESYAIKDNNEALLVNRVMPMAKKTIALTRSEVEKLFNQAISKDEKLFILNPNGVLNNGLTLMSESDIYKGIKEDLLQDIEYSNYLKKNPTLFQFTKKSLNYSSLHKINIDMNISTNVILVKTTGKNISIQSVDITLIQPDKYKVDICNIPVTKYSLEKVKYWSPTITQMPEPIINRMINPGISKNDVKVAHAKIKSLKK